MTLQPSALTGTQVQSLQDDWGVEAAKPPTMANGAQTSSNTKKDTREIENSYHSVSACFASYLPPFTHQKSIVVFNLYHIIQQRCQSGVSTCSTRCRKDT